MTLREMLKEIVERGDPSVRDGNTAKCIYCGSQVPRDDRPWFHYPDCVWRLAKKWLEKQGAERK